MSGFGRVVAWLFSVGWLVPLCAAMLLLDDWVHAILWPSIRAGSSNENMNSFPFYNSAKIAFWIAFVWLALVVCYWVHRQVSRVGKE